MSGVGAIPQSTGTSKARTNAAVSTSHSRMNAPRVISEAAPAAWNMASLDGRFMGVGSREDLRLPHQAHFAPKSMARSHTVRWKRAFANAGLDEILGKP